MKLGYNEVTGYSNGCDGDSNYGLSLGQCCFYDEAKENVSHYNVLEGKCNLVTTKSCKVFDPIGRTCVQCSDTYHMNR